MASETPDDSTCPTCSKPIRPEMPVMFDHGVIFHLACRSQESMEEPTAEHLARAATSLVCPVCEQAFADKGAAIRQGGTYVHLACAA